jgi:hypothetical protein
MHKTKRTNKHFKKTRKVRTKLPKKSKYNYCKKGMTDEANRIYNFILEAKSHNLKQNQNQNQTKINDQ